MPRILRALFRRDTARDRRENDILLEGYAIFWPDGRPMTVGLDAFCTHGQRLLGLGRHLAGRRERVVELLCFPLTHREDDLTRRPGLRVRRFCLVREGRIGRLHFLDRTPTAVTFDLDADDPRVLHWIGLYGLVEGGERWLDLAAVVADAAPPAVSVPLPLGRPHDAAIP